ncbi:hypothetical protein IBE48_09335 [Francisella philomiragia]|uniref:Intracellular multiplication and macrophage-killing family protein n=1 Tax=Francisella philomiragia TaxID=28110 RepID=A0AAW3DD01_9GAMM|nr:ImcF-related family protein [Francisella philomiragia]KFJ43497.1 intracellular multiplication and macrophage-killing family protein [Francisella philomiragia]MBK2255651.1 hypothetical protein [Francisella philomiragia]MBK2273964.1 hypothetical protein [Francisella philomiragia]MBK2277805.1 hypothetical protein [Francisella philomiragia]MBK2281751.1 hypothetical protein [Francisella philomiragia]
MTNLFRKIPLALSKFIRTRWFLFLVVFCVILLLIWLVIPGVSLFGFSILKSTNAKLFTTLLLIVVILIYVLHKKNLLSFSSFVVFLAKRKNKKTKALNLTSYKVREELKKLSLLLKKRKKISKINTPVYAILGDNKECIEALMRHTSKSSVTNDSISVVDKFNSSELSWNISVDKALIALFNLKNFYGLFQHIYAMDKHYPINGIIYAISLDKIFESKDAISSYQKKIQTEIFELRKYLEKINKKFHIKIPVYVTFTGMEVIYGFEDYFSVASDKFKYDPFGITLAENESISFRRIREKFQEFFDSLNENIIIKCDNTQSTEKVINIITFSKQVLFCLDTIEYSLDRFFDNKIQEQILVRGFYFVSYKNSDTCFDFMRMQSLNKVKKSMDQRVYFLDNLFKKIILKEVYNFGENTTYIKKLKYRDYSKSAVLLSCGFILSFVWIKSSLSYINLFNSVDSKYNKALHSNIGANNAAIEFAKQINYEHGLSLYGLYYSKALITDIFKIYQRLVQIKFLPDLQSDIEKQLRQAIKEIPKDNTANSKQIENLNMWLATYLMLVNKEHFNEAFFTRNIHAMWKKQKISAQDLSDNEELLKAVIISGFPDTIKLNKSLLFEARNILRSSSTYVLAYQMLKDKALIDSDEYILLGDSGDLNTSLVFDNKVVKLPALYTKKGYYNIYLKNQVEYLKQAAKSMWVLSEEDSFDKLSLVSLKSNMDILYWNDYLEVWNKALDDINIQRTTSISTLIKILNSLTVENNSIISVLKKITQNTNFISVEDISSKVGLSSNNRNIVTTSYRGLIKSLAEYKKSQASEGDSSKGSGTISMIASELGDIRNSLVVISLSSQPDLDAFLLVQNKKDSAIFKNLSSLWEMGNNAPQPVKKWTSQLVNITTRVLNDMAMKEINMRWQKGPLSYYDSYLKDRYPIRLESRKESSTKSFIEFFKKDGVMQKFIKENMSSLIEKSSNSSGYVWKKYYGEPFAYDENFLEMINSFNMIENMFFSNDGIGFKLFLTPEFLAKDLSVLTINYANKSYSYANGPQEDFIIEWPTTNINKSPVTISYTSKENETNMINFDGEWGLFKFLEKGSISYNDEKGVNIFKIYNDKNILAEYILKTSSLDDKFSFDTFKKLHVFDNIDNSREVNK